MSLDWSPAQQEEYVMPEEGFEPLDSQVRQFKAELNGNLVNSTGSASFPIDDSNQAQILQPFQIVEHKMSVRLIEEIVNAAQKAVNAAQESLNDAQKALNAAKDVVNENRANGFCIEQNTSRGQSTGIKEESIKKLPVVGKPRRSRGARGARAKIACNICRERKVKYIIGPTGPCAGCKGEGQHCEVSSSRRRNCANKKTIREDRESEGSLLKCA
ncbi:uncharacterized protein BDZ99DRAFT_474877 [Mytilinidion resinicola]|uniref:Uncharacterized protein n=1 Tax=Mytilinidion resinicola TaxID=574789 RepID=A0A6A6YUY0_9PEZI|nr:uncharacterized protein BDZ99DRAFT_474877 [Mytilinidion resinicola]KAF2812766.1 hypothetical protein BDZ99DRAFT_474877 [Mytilinidion resinicola]